MSINSDSSSSSELDSNDSVSSSTSSDCVDLTGDDEVDSIRIQSLLFENVEPLARGDIELGGDEALSIEDVGGSDVEEVGLSDRYRTHERYDHIRRGYYKDPVETIPKSYWFPTGWSVIEPSETDRMNAPPDNCRAINVHHLDLGLRFPIVDEIAEILNRLSLSPIQIVPNGMAQIIAFCLIIKGFGQTPSFANFCNLFVVNESPKSNVGFYYVKAKTKKTFLSPNQSGYGKEWKHRFVYVCPPEGYVWNIRNGWRTGPIRLGQVPNPSWGPRFVSKLREDTYNIKRVLSEQVLRVGGMSKSKPRKRDPSLEEAIMSCRAKRIMENVGRGGRSSGSSQAPRVQSVTHDRNHSPARPQRENRSRENEASNPEDVRSNKRPREEGEIVARRPGKESVLEVSSDEDIESVMNSDHARAGELAVDTSVLDPGDELKAWKVFKSTIFKKDQTKLGKKHLKENLKKASCDLVSVNNVLYQGYVLAERAFKDLDKLKKKFGEQLSLVRTYAATSKEAETKRKEVEDELQRKEDQVVDIVGQLSSRNLEVEELKKKNEELVERMKLESKESFEKGRAEGLLMTSQPTREQKLAIAREFVRSPVCDALSDMKTGIELYGVFDKAWKQCRKLGFLNERFDERALDPLKNDDCEPFPVTENDVVPVLERDEFYPIYLEANDSGVPAVVVEPPIEQAAAGSQAQVEQHRVLTQEQIDSLYAHGVIGGDNMNVDGFDHIDVTNLIENGTQNQE